MPDISCPDPSWDYYTIYSYTGGAIDAASEAIEFMSQQENATPTNNAELLGRLTRAISSLEAARHLLYQKSNAPVNAHPSAQPSIKSS